MVDFPEFGEDIDAVDGDDAAVARRLARLIQVVIDYSETHGYFGMSDILAKARDEAQRIAGGEGRPTLMN